MVVKFNMEIIVNGIMIITYKVIENLIQQIICLKDHFIDHVQI